LVVARWVSFRTVSEGIVAAAPLPLISNTPRFLALGRPKGTAWLPGLTPSIRFARKRGLAKQGSEKTGPIASNQALIPGRVPRRFAPLSGTNPRVFRGNDEAPSLQRRVRQTGWRRGSPPN